MALDEAQAISALTVLTRLAQREQDTEAMIREAIMGDPTNMLGPAVQVAIETGAPMPAVLNSILRDGNLPVDAVRDLRRRIPAHTMSLRETDALAADLLLAAGDSAEVETSPRLLHEYAERLLETGDTERALTTAQRAVQYAEQQRASDPHRLIEALRVLSACEVAAGHAEQAVATAERAIPVLYEMSRLGMLWPDVAAGAYATLGKRCLGAQQVDRALEELFVAAALCAAYLGEALPGEPDPSESAQLHRELLTTETMDSFTSGVEENTDKLYFAVPMEAQSSVVTALNQSLAVTSLILSSALRSQDRHTEALEHALQAEGILRELGAESPDKFDVHHAEALLEVRLCLAGESDDPHVHALKEELTPLLPAALSILCADSARRRDVDRLQTLVQMLVSAARETSPADQLATLGELISQALDHLRNGLVAVAVVMLRWAVRFARAVAEESDEGKIALSRALNALARAEEEAGLDAAPETAAEAHAVAVAVSAAPGGDEQMLARQRSIAANGLANRLGTAGRREEALDARLQSIDALSVVYDRGSQDDVWFAVVGVAALLREAEELGRLASVPDATLAFATDVLEGFTNHRDLARLYESLQYAGFLTVTAFARRDNSDETARALRALAVLAHRYPNDPGIVAAMAMAPLNAIGCHQRTARFELADAALEALAGLVGEHPDDVEARLQLAKCGNLLVNAYIDFDVEAAAAVIQVADAGLRSPEYLALLPSLGESDPPGYLEWLNQIEAAGRDEPSDGQGPSLTPVQLEAAIRDYRATAAQRSDELGEGHRLTIATRLRLAMLLEMAGDTAAAAQEARVTYNASVEAFGPGDPNTADAIEIWRRCAGAGADDLP